MRRSGRAEELRWLELRTPDDEYFSSGWDARGWDDAVWIFHAMYEDPDLPGGLTYEQVDRIETAAGLPGPADDFPELAQLLADSTLVFPGGAVRAPGPPWRRLHWVELGERLAVDPFRGRPCMGTFPYRSWPVSILPPSEGDLDRDQLERLVVHLAAVTEAGLDAACFFHWSPAATASSDGLLFEGRLGDLLEVDDDESLPGTTPSNVWPRDRAWLVYTDWDLWGTKVSGSRELIEAILADEELETRQLPF